MSKKRRTFALDTTRDMLKLNGVGAIACFAIAPNMGEMNILVWCGGIMFALGVLDSLWTIRQVMESEKLSEEQAADVKINIDSGLLFFGMAVVACTIGVVATNFSKHSQISPIQAHLDMATKP